MGTVRIGGIVKSGPSTQFWLEADWVRQNVGGNYSVLGVWLRAANGPGGNSTSRFLDWGKQTAHANGYLAEHSGAPFLPSGYAQNQQRWHDYFERVFYHDANGHGPSVGLAMELVYGGVNEIHYGSIGAPGRIPKPPNPPGNFRVRAGTVTPTCAGVDYNRGATNGAAITADQVQWSTTPNFSNVIWTDGNGSPGNGPAGYTNPCGAGLPNLLEPGRTYYLRGRSDAYGYGWSGWSSTFQLTTLPSSPPGITVNPALSGQRASVVLTPPGGVSGVTRYDVQYELLPGGSTQNANGPGSPVVVQNLSPGSQYRWRARAIIGGYESPWSNWVTVYQPNPNTSPGDYFDGSTADTADEDFTWDGAVDNSPSRATGVTPEGWSAVGTGGRAVIQRVIGGVSDGHAARVTVQQDSTLVRAGMQAADPYWSDIEAGATYYGSMYVAAPVDTTLTPEMSWYSASGVLLGRVLGDPVLVTAGSAFDNRLLVVATAPNNAEFAVVNVVGTDMLAGTTFDLDAASVFLSSQFPWFSGDSAPTLEFSYEWLGPANASVTARNPLDLTTVDLLADPDCPPPPLPPSAPTIVDPCITEVGTWRRYWAVLAPGTVTRWLDVVPTFRLTTQGDPARQVRVRIFPNPDNVLPEEFDSSTGWVSEQIVSYIPPESTVRIDGVSERVRASVRGGEWIAADRLLYGTGGAPATWPVLDCGLPYLIAFDAPLDAPSGNLSLEVELTRRH